MFGLVPKESFYQDLFDFRRDFDQIFNRILVGKPWLEDKLVYEKDFVFTPAIESWLDKEGRKFFCRIFLPGVEPKDVEIKVQGDLLTIRGERKFTRELKEVDMLVQEMTYGKFERTLTLPEGVLTDKLVAEYTYGVLELTAPITAAVLPRKIEIKTLKTLAA